MCISNLFNKDVKGKTTESVSDKPTAWREIPPFESIGLDTFADVVLIKGEQERLLIVSGQDIGQAIKTEVEGKRLWISTTNDGPETLPETTLYITYVSINGLVVNHAGRILYTAFC